MCCKSGAAAMDVSVMGTGMVSPGDVCAVLRGLTSPLAWSTSVGVVPADWAQYERIIGVRMSLLSSVVDREAGSSKECVSLRAGAGDSSLAPSCRSKSSSAAARVPSVSRESVGLMLSSCVSEMLCGDVHPSEPLLAAGLDSLGAVQLQQSVRTKLARTSP